MSKEAGEMSEKTRNLLARLSVPKKLKINAQKERQLLKESLQPKPLSPDLFEPVNNNPFVPCEENNFGLPFRNLCP